MLRRRFKTVRGGVHFYVHQCDMCFRNYVCTHDGECKQPSRCRECAAEERES